MNISTVTFGQFNMSLLNKSIHLFQNKTKFPYFNGSVYVKHVYQTEEHCMCRALGLLGLHISQLDNTPLCFWNATNVLYLFLPPEKWHRSPDHVTYVII